MSFFKKRHRVAMVLLFVGLACGRIRAQNTPVADISAGYSIFYVVKGFTLATNGGEVTLRRLLEALLARTRLYSAPAGAPILGSTVPENSRCVPNWIISVSARTAARRITFASRVLPHTEVSVKPPDVGKDIPPIDGRRLANSATLKLIPMNDLVTLPTTGRHFSLKEIGADGKKL